MYLLLKKNNIYFILIFTIISILIYNFFFKEANFKSETLLSINKIEFDINEYENFVKIIQSGINSEKNLPLIAHAGGGFNDLTYTNSIDALELNKKNYKFFELDFFLTDDGKLVCAHDWSENLKSFSKFQTYVNNKKDFKPCTYLSLKDWLKLNPDAKIITDIKNDNLSGLKFISKNFENFEKNFIPQIYKPNEYKIIRDMGYENIIWTLYRYKKNNKKVINSLKKMNLFAITMPKNRAQSDLPLFLKKNNIKSYVHTINSMKEYFIYTNYFKVDQIYTDWIK